MPSPAASEFKNSAGGRMLMAPSGAFTMGSPETEAGHRVWERQRKVRFVREFYLAETPVTQLQYQAVTGENPTHHRPIEDAPVDSVNWLQATEYCERLTRLDHESGLLPDDWEYRLPTEAEWEYACRAGSSESPEISWYHENSDHQPHAVGQKTPNTWGFHDLLGNVWEWCQDWFCRANPSRSVRGGSYFNSARFCRPAQRWGWMPANRGRYCGFRLLAAEKASFESSPPIDDFPQPELVPTIYDAITTDDFALAERVFAADPAAIESVDYIPPPLHHCIYADKPEMLAWLLDHGADLERREQDYGSTPLNTAVVLRRRNIIRRLVQRGADASNARSLAQRGLAGEFEDDPSLDRAGYRKVIELLRELGIDGP